MTATISAFVGMIILLSFSAEASESTALTRVYYCWADGVDGNGNVHTVTGERKRTIPAAKASALQVCSDAWLGNCTVQNCQQIDQ